MIVQSTPGSASSRTVRKKPEEAAAISSAFAQQREDEALLVAEQGAFDSQLAQKAEMQREANALRDLQLEQMKRDDEIVKKYIAMI